ncbi:unnamed protein product [Rotaria magnacalcarata]
MNFRTVPSLRTRAELLPPTGDDPSAIYTFENQNSIVWNSLRLKPPTSEDLTSLGRRIEFPPMGNIIQQSKFHFPTTIFHDLNSNRNQSSSVSKTREMTIDEIINDSNNFIG